MKKKMKKLGEKMKKYSLGRYERGPHQGMGGYWILID